MLSLDKMRKVDPQMEKLTDEELKAIRQSFYELGNLIFDDWCEQKFGSKNPVGDIGNSKNKGKI